MSTYKFRFLKSTWGIAILITAEYLTPESYFNDQGHKVTEHLFLEVKEGIANSEDIDYLVKGLSRISDQIVSHLKTPYVVIRVTDLIYHLTDFQEEGMAHAIMGWVAQEFGLDVVFPPIEFDKAANRYIFTL